MTTSAFLDLAAVSASKTTAAGSDPSLCFMISTPARWVHTSSWSIAAALKVSAAATMTFLPLLWSWLASFPIVVVFPTPFTPITRITEGWVERSRGTSSPSISAMISFSISLTARGSVIPFAFTWERSSSQIFSEVVTPISDVISVSSSSSNSSSSIFVNEWSSRSILPIIESLVFLRPAFSFSKNPTYIISYWSNFILTVSPGSIFRSLEIPSSCIVTP